MNWKKNWNFELIEAYESISFMAYSSLKIGQSAKRKFRVANGSLNFWNGHVGQVNKLSGVIKGH